MLQNLMLCWIPCVTRLFHVQHRFSAFWLRSKCSICSYQLNIWYGGHVPPSILNWFLQGDEVQELAPASSRVGLALQYRQDRPTSPLRPRDPHHHQSTITPPFNTTKSDKCQRVWCSLAGGFHTICAECWILSSFWWHVNALLWPYFDLNPHIMIIMMTVEMKNVFNLNLLFICCVKTTLV